VTIEVEIKEIKEILGELSKKLDALVLDQETLGIMIASEQSLKDFLVSEPDLYSTKDLKVAYR
jgi:hypothetical protein